MSQQKNTALVAVEKLKSPEMVKAIRGVLPETVSVDRFLAIAAAEIKNPNLASITDVSSILLGVFHSAKLGLSLNPHMGEAYLVPFRCKVKRRDAATGEMVEGKETIAQFIPGYKGLVKLARNAGLKDIQPTVVHEKDEFEHWEDEAGFHFKLKTSHELNRGRVVCVITRAILNDGTSSIKVTWADKLEKIKKAALNKTHNTGPWDTHPDEMAAKTGIRHHCKTLPQTDALAYAVRADETLEGGPVDGAVPDELAGVVEADYQVVNEPADTSSKPDVQMPTQKAPVSPVEAPKQPRGRGRPKAQADPVQGQGGPDSAHGGQNTGKTEDWVNELYEMFGFAGIEQPDSWLDAEYSVAGGVEKIPENLRPTIKMHLKQLIEAPEMGAGA